MAHALGACSPKTTWRKETSATATVDVMPSCAADSWRYRSCSAVCTVLAFRSPRRTSASMRVRRAATSANSAATKNAFASTSATSAARRRPSDSVADPDIEAGTYPVVTRLQAPPFDVLAPYLPTRGAAADPETATAVRAIIEDVRARGDAAVVDHARRLDGVELAPEQWEVSGARCEEALARIPRALRAALELAAARVRAYHEKQVEPGFLERDAEGTALGMRVVPLERVGVYVPGGKAAYPSTVIMNTVPAVVAGVPEIVMVTPPGGTPDVVLAAARLAGVTRVFRVGGAQAIAALAFGTRTVPRVDKIVGPGNRFVTEAKRQVAGDVGIDMLAGPTEVLVLADDTADVRAVAADLIAQAEHDEDACAWCVTTSTLLADGLSGELARQME